MSFLVVSKRTEKENKKERKRMSYQEHEANIDRGERELRRRKERRRKEGRKEGLLGSHYRRRRFARRVPLGPRQKKRVPRFSIR